MAEYWHQIFSFIQDPLLGFWKTMLGWPVIGDILSWLEVTIGRGATPL